MYKWLLYINSHSLTSKNKICEIYDQVSFTVCVQYSQYKYILHNSLGDYPT